MAKLRSPLRAMVGQCSVLTFLAALCEARGGHGRRGEAAVSARVRLSVSHSENHFPSAKCEARPKEWLSTYDPGPFIQ